MHAYKDPVRSCTAGGTRAGTCFLGFVLAAVSVQAANATETRSFVVHSFYSASYAGDEATDCPKGMSTSSGLTERLLRQNYPPEVVKELLETGRYKNTNTYLAVMKRGKINGEPADISLYPESVADPHLPTFEGRYAYGFNLDGKGDKPSSFEDPETHERGVDNQFWRVLGCNEVYHTKPPDLPFFEKTMGTMVRNTVPPWLVTITGEDLSKDGDVTITFDRALQHAELDANGNTLADQTFMADPAPRSHHVLRGRMKDGTVTTTEPGYLNMLYEATFMPEIELRKAQVRLHLQPEGISVGYLGGYTPWVSFWYLYAKDAFDPSLALDLSGIYYSFKRLADGDPDPVTGQITTVSATFRIELVPAFVVESRLSSDSGAAGRLKQ